MQRKRRKEYTFLSLSFEKKNLLVEEYEFVERGDRDKIKEDTLSSLSCLERLLAFFSLTLCREEKRMLHF